MSTDPTQTSELPDIAASLPLHTGSFAAPQAPGDEVLDSRHLLVLPGGVSVETVEALVLSQDARAGWVDVSSLQLVPGAVLQGPWEADGELRRRLDLPQWAECLMVLECQVERGGRLPAELAGLDPVADAFPFAQPEGTELLALTRLKALAIRLGGALRLAGDGVVPEIVVPARGDTIAWTLYSPVWIAPDALEVLLQPVVPQARARLDVRSSGRPTGLDALSPEEQQRLEASLGKEVLERARAAARARDEAQAGTEGDYVLDGYAVEALVRPDGGHGVVETRVQGAEDTPLALRHEPWYQQDVVMYSLVWQRGSLPPGAGPRVRASARRGAAALVEVLAKVLQDGVGGRVVDENGFLLDLEG